jgi:hypothetical protein
MRNKGVSISGKSKSLVFLLSFTFVFSMFGGALLGNVGTADPWFYVKEGIAQPPAGLPPSNVTITSPQNITYHKDTIQLTANAEIPNPNDGSFYDTTEAYYTASWQEGKVDFWPHNITLTDVPEGSQYVQVSIFNVFRVNEHQYSDIGVIGYSAYRLGGTARIYFSVDLPPTINITSIINGTIYKSSNVTLDFTTSEPNKELMYCLDGTNQTISGNSTLNFPRDGWHNLTVYAWDYGGNLGISQTVQFSTQTTFTLSPIVYSTAIILAISVGSVVLFKKLHPSQRKQMHTGPKR